MKSALACGLELGAKQGVRDANRSALNCGDIAVAYITKCFVEVDAEVVCKLAFQHDSAVDAVAEPPA